MEWELGFWWVAVMDVRNHHTLSEFRVTHQAAVYRLFKHDGWIRLKQAMEDGTTIRVKCGASSLRGRKSSGRLMWRGVLVRGRELLAVTQVGTLKAFQTAQCRVRIRYSPAIRTGRTFSGPQGLYFPGHTASRNAIFSGFRRLDPFLGLPRLGPCYTFEQPDGLRPAGDV